MTTPLLSLVMIVKDEVKSIQPIRQSVHGVVDRYLIVDTGSTDGTVELIRSEFADMEGELIQKPFVDFSTTRNLSLDLAQEQGAEFGILLSGDEAIGGDASELRRFCEEKLSATEGAYNVQIQYGGFHFDSPRLVRLKSGWRYTGVVHEVLMKEGEPPATIRVPGCHIIHSGADPNRKRLRLYKDLELLREQIRKTPLDSRAQFYFAQTLEDLGFFAQAHEAYRRRVEMIGWIEECYEAAFRMARTAHILGRSWAEVQQLYLDAHSRDPRRAEPLFAIATHWYQVGNHALCWLFAARGAALPYPTACTLFVQADVYQWRLADLAGTCGFYVGEYELGEKYARQAIEANPNDPRLVGNMGHYEMRKALSDFTPEAASL